MIHPEYAKNSVKIVNWYDDSEIRTGHIAPHCWFSPYQLLLPHYFPGPIRQKWYEYFEAQIPFILKMKNSNIIVTDDHVERYKKFLYLIKKYKGKSLLVPPLDVDIVWHAHMLRRDHYEKDTEDYFGHILDHDDSIATQQLKRSERQTRYLWQKEYGDSYTILLATMAGASLASRSPHTESQNTSRDDGGYAAVAHANHLGGNSTGHGHHMANSCGEDAIACGSSCGDSGCGGGCGSSCGSSCGGGCGG
jgi:hypothetical protein